LWFFLADGWSWVECVVVAGPSLSLDAGGHWRSAVSDGQHCFLTIEPSGAYAWPIEWPAWLFPGENMKNYIPHTIRIRLAGARQVSLVGDFNNWHSSAHPLVQVGPDLWERIVDLPVGKHRYAFFVIDDLGASGGAVKSRVVGNGAVLWVPERAGQSLSITAHPGLSVGGFSERRVA
jgi:hypothetical protein